MRHILRSCLLACTLLASLGAQTGPYDDLGLTMDGGVLTVIYGQVCGPVACASLPAGTVSGGESRSLVVYGAPVTPFVVALGLPQPCAAIPGFGNGLLLGAPVITLAVGTTSAPPFVPTPCNQGVAIVSLPVPRGTPAGITFRVQSLGIGQSGLPGFGPTLEARTQ